MKRAMAALAFLALTAPLGWAQLRVKAEREYAPHRKIVLQAADVTSAKAQFLWDVDGDADTVEAGGTLYVWAAPGTYKVRLTAIDFDAKKVERATFSFTVRGQVTPPGPKPDDPPDVKPPGPVPVKSVRVLVVYDAGQALPLSQQLVLQGKAFRDHMKGRGPVTAADPFGPARIWPKDADVSAAPSEWRALFGRPRASVPWLVVEGDGKVLHEGPLPADTKATIDQIEKAAPPAAASTRKAG